jgi:Aldo/keto reductase family
MLGLGVWQVPNGDECVSAVRWALEAGYRHVDTAQAYGNEDSVGRALRDSRVPPEELFITTKFHPGRRDPVAEVQRSLQRLGVDQVDLYLVHWPQRGATRAWPGMERARELGLARSIGVSNLGQADPGRALQRTGHQPRGATRRHLADDTPPEPGPANIPQATYPPMRRRRVGLARRRGASPTPRRGPILLEASGLIILLFGLVVAARSPALSRRHRARPSGV